MEHQRLARAAAADSARLAVRERADRAAAAVDWLLLLALERRVQRTQAAAAARAVMQLLRADRE